MDFQDLNKYSTRETHSTASPYDQARSVPADTKKTVCDAWNGYHSVPLHNDDRHFTTFLTPWGRYRYKTTPQGYAASGDGYTRRYDEIISHIGNHTKCIDDALIWADDTPTCYDRTVEWLTTCGNKGITLNPKKFVFAKDTVEFAGHTISPSSILPSPSYTQSIRDFPTPKSLTNLRAWFGLINQVAYMFSTTEPMKPFRHLLKQNEPFKWTQELQTAMDSAKDHIIGLMATGVRIYDKCLPKCLVTDWSKEGVGF